MDLETNVPVTRRRGAELESALLDAAWQELFEKGYTGLTFDAVAERAHTSRPVIYRRWPDKEALVLAAIKHHVTGRRRGIPDTGNLRDDFVELLSQSGLRSGEMIPLVSMLFGGFYTATGETVAQLRERIIDSGTPAMDILLERARQRGEHVPSRVPERVTRLPYDLLRHEVFMSMRQPSDEFVVSAVDDVIMPLIEAYADREDAARDAAADTSD